MGRIFFVVIAVIYLIAALAFLFEKKWVWALGAFGCSLVLISNVLAISQSSCQP
jgi:hypothetical protein